METTNVLITGATGFVGRALTKQLLQGPYIVNAIVRNLSHQLVKENSNCNFIVVPDIATEKNWASILKNIDVVIHLAARVHVLTENAENPLAEFRRVNTEATLQLARAAALAGARRFIFMSTIKVNGDITGQIPFTENDIPETPCDYSRSKLEAEIALLALAKTTSTMDIAIVRPPLVYGPNVGGNFLQLLKMVKKGLPLPLAMIKNKRSFIHVKNLAEFVEVVIHHPDAANQIFVVADGEDISTPELIKKMAFHLEKGAFLLPIPSWLLKLGCAVIGKKQLHDKLCASLQVLPKKSREVLSWYPSTTLDAGLKETTEWFKQL